MNHLCKSDPALSNEEFETISLSISRPRGSAETLVERDGSSLDNESQLALPLVRSPTAAPPRCACTQCDSDRLEQPDVFG